MMKTLIRRCAKVLLFIALFYLIALQIHSSEFISLDMAYDFAVWSSGHASQENIDDLWFFTDVSLSLLFTIIAYNGVMFLSRKISTSKG